MDTKIWGIIGGIALVLALLSPFVLGSTEKVERIFEAAEELYEQGQYEDAIAKYNKVLKEAKKVGVNIETLDVDFIACVNYKIARCLKLLDRVDEALQHYRFIAFQFPDSQYATDSYVDSGDIYFDRKDYEAASEAYKRALDTIGDAEHKKQIHQKYQQTLVLIDPPKPTPIPEPFLPEAEEINIPNFAALTEATSLRFEERFKEAAVQYESFANAYLPLEDAVYALYWAGHCYSLAAANENLLKKSEEAFQRLIEDYGNHPNAIEAYHGLAKVYCDWAEKEGDTSKWELVTRTIEEAKKRYSSSNAALDREFLRLMEEIMDKVPVPPDPLEEIVRQGRMYLARNELQLAARKAREALRINSTYQPAHQLLAEIKKNYYKQGLLDLDNNQYSNAIIEFKGAISIDSQYKDKEAYFNLGVAYFNLHNLAYAEDAALNALDIDPSYEEARRLLNTIREQNN